MAAAGRSKSRVNRSYGSRVVEDRTWLNADGHAGRGARRCDMPA